MAGEPFLDGGTYRGRLDAAGMVLFGAGLAGLVYGFAEAGTRGWASPVVLASLAAGALLLLVFAAWQLRLTRSQQREPLADVGLFRVPAYVWGTVLAFLCSLAMIGVLFTLPHYFHAVLGADSIGSGLRLLPLLGGLALGAMVAEPAVKGAGSKVVVAAGFAAMGGGLLLRHGTRASSGHGFLFTWTPVTGVGIGIVIATATALQHIPAAFRAALSAGYATLTDEQRDLDNRRNELIRAVPEVRAAHLDTSPLARSTSPRPWQNAPDGGPLTPTPSRSVARSSES
jgi:MFS transporter, DHA2 family, multidrug resistance protein